MSEHHEGPQPEPEPEPQPESRVDPAERWGWELREPEVPLPTPFTEEPPALPALDASWSTRLAGSRDKAIRGWYAHVQRIAGFGLAASATWFSTALPWTFTPWITGGLGAVTAVSAYFTARPMVLPWWGDLRYRRWRGKLLEQQKALVQQTREWAARREAYDVGLDTESRPERWEPLRPETSHRVDVYGGDPYGCEALLLSVAGSLLDTGTPVTVVDLSQDGICHGLVHQTVNQRRRVFAASLPEDIPAIGLLAGLTPEDIGGVVGEAVHVLERERSAGGDKTLDATLIEQVAGCLRQPVTLGRLHTAVRAVTHQESYPEGLDRDEYERLVDLLGEGARRSVEGRLFRITAALQRLSALEASGRPAKQSAQQASRNAELQVWDLSERVGELGGELLAHVVFQVVLHRLRHAESGEGRVLIVLGADRFRRAHLERLDQLARRRGVRLVCFFRHLREDAVELLGGGEAVMFMRLGNAKEAEHAANFIGKDHRLVLSQFTVQHSSSMSTTVGTSTTESLSDSESVSKGKQWSRSRNYRYTALVDFPHDGGNRSKGGQDSRTTGRTTSTSTGESQSEQSGTSESRSTGYQRVYEYSVEPRFLQALSPTAFVLVDPRDPGSPRVGDASPELDPQLRSIPRKGTEVPRHGVPEPNQLGRGEPRPAPPHQVQQQQTQPQPTQQPVERPAQQPQPTQQQERQQPQEPQPAPPRQQPTPPNPPRP